MKKALLFSLLILFLFNTIGHYAVFFIREHQLEEEFEEQLRFTLPDNELAVLVITSQNASQLEWDGDNEFLYHDNYYDVVRKEVKKNGSTWYYCFSDKQETKLVAEFKHNLDHTNNTSAEDNALQKAMKAMEKEYLQDTENFHLSFTHVPKTITPYLISPYLTEMPEIMAPPPELFS